MCAGGRRIVEDVFYGILRVTACMDETDHNALENADKTSLLLFDELSSSRREVLSEHLRTRKALR